jgi:hypothetical protein
LANKWNGRERRTSTEDREGRRAGDQRCPDHHLLWKQHDEDKSNFRKDNERNQGLACRKIKALEEYHVRDLNEVKTDMDKKADKDDLKPIVNSVKNLIIIGCLVVGSIMSGALIWIKSDVASIAPSIQRVNVRITESMNDRIKTDFEQTQKLEAIAGQIGTVNWRLAQIEDAHKPNNKFMPDRQDGKNTKP